MCCAGMTQSQWSSKVQERSKKWLVLALTFSV